MKKALFFIFIALVFFLSGTFVGIYTHSKPAFAVNCGSVKAMSMKLMKRHLGFLATAIDNRGRVYMFFLNGKTGNWTILHVYPRAIKSCLFMRGYDWRFALPPTVKKALMQQEQLHVKLKQ